MSIAFDIDLDDVDFDAVGKGGGADGNFDPIKPGWYKADILDVELIDFSQKDGYDGNDAYNLQFKISDGQEFANRRVFKRLYLKPKFPSGKGNGSLISFLVAVSGKTTEEFKANPPKTIPTPADLAGTSLEIEVGLVKDDYAFNKAKAEAQNAGVPFTQTENDFKRNEITFHGYRAAGSPNPNAGKDKATTIDAVEL